MPRERRPARTPKLVIDSCFSGHSRSRARETRERGACSRQGQAPLSVSLLLHLYHSDPDESIKLCVLFLLSLSLLSPLVSVSYRPSPSPACRREWQSRRVRSITCNGPHRTHRWAYMTHCSWLIER